MLQSILPCSFSHLNCLFAETCLNESICVNSFFLERFLSEGCLLSSTMIPEQLPSPLHSMHREYLPKTMPPEQLGSVRAALPFFTQLQDRAKPAVPICLLCTCALSSRLLTRGGWTGQWFCHWPAGRSWGAPEAPQPLTCLLGWHLPWAGGWNRLDLPCSVRERDAACRSLQQTS